MRSKRSCSRRAVSALAHKGHSRLKGSAARQAHPSTPAPPLTRTPRASSCSCSRCIQHTKGQARQEESEEGAGHTRAAWRDAGEGLEEQALQEVSVMKEEGQGTAAAACPRCRCRCCCARNVQELVEEKEAVIGLGLKNGGGCSGGCSATAGAVEAASHVGQQGGQQRWRG